MNQRIIELQQKIKEAQKEIEQIRIRIVTPNRNKARHHIKVPVIQYRQGIAQNIKVSIKVHQIHSKYPKRVTRY